MISNQAFQKLLASHSGIALLEVTRDFRTFVGGGFVDVEGAIFFRRQFSGNKLLALARHRDRTGYECVVNKFYVEDYMEPDVGREPATLAAFAKLFAEFIATRLASFSSDTFRMIGNVTDGTSTLRFHKVRDGEEWLTDDLETYNEALFFIEQPPGK